MVAGEQRQVADGWATPPTMVEGGQVDQNLPFILFATQNGAGGAAITFDWTLKFSFSFIGT